MLGKSFASDLHRMAMIAEVVVCGGDAVILRVAWPSRLFNGVVKGDGGGGWGCEVGQRVERFDGDRSLSAWHVSQNLIECSSPSTLYPKPLNFSFFQPLLRHPRYHHHHQHCYRSHLHHWPTQPLPKAVLKYDGSHKKLHKLLPKPLLKQWEYGETE